MHGHLNVKKVVCTQNLRLFRIPAHCSGGKKCDVQTVARHWYGNTVADNGHLISNTHITETLQHTNFYSDYIDNQLKKIIIIKIKKEKKNVYS